VLTTCRFSGHVTQKGPMKSGASGQVSGRILADFVQKGPKRDLASKKLVFLLCL
jgi:hypothetical protein